MTVRTDVGAVEGEVRFFLLAVTVRVVRIAPEVGDGATIIPAAVIRSIFLLVIADLDGLVITFETMAAVAFQMLVDQAGPDAVILLVIA